METVEECIQIAKHKIITCHQYSTNLTVRCTFVDERANILVYKYFGALHHPIGCSAPKDL